MADSSAAKSQELGPMGNSSPYLLTIIVHSANNLPIADTLSRTSDPYVSICVDNKEVDHTKTVEKELNPIWEHFKEIPLLHPHVEIKFLVYDSDFGTTQDDLLGLVKLNIDEITVGTHPEEQDYYRSGEVEDIVMNKKNHTLVGHPAGISPTGELKLSILLIRNKEIITLSHNSGHRYEAGSVGKHTESLLQSSGLLTHLGLSPSSKTSKIPFFPTLGPIRKALSSIPTSLNKREIVRDVLMDVSNSILQISRDASENPSLSLLRRNRIGKLAMSIYSIARRSTSSTAIDLQRLFQATDSAADQSPSFSNPTYIRGLAPNHEICLQFFLSSSEKSSAISQEVKLHLPNKYCLWVWVRWIRLAIEVWTDQRNSPLPSWAENKSIVTMGCTIEYSDSWAGERSSSNQNTLAADGSNLLEFMSASAPVRKFAGNVSLSLNDPFRIKTEDPATSKTIDELSWKTCQQVAFSVDCPLAKSHSLQLEINSMLFKHAPDKSIDADNFQRSNELYYVVASSSDGHYHRTKSLSGPYPNWDESLYLDCNKDNLTGFVEVFLFKDVVGTGYLLGQQKIMYSELVRGLEPTKHNVSRSSVDSSVQKKLNSAPDDMSKATVTALENAMKADQSGARVWSDDDVSGEYTAAIACPCELNLFVVSGDDLSTKTSQDISFVLPGLFLKCVPVDWNGKKSAANGALPTTLKSDLRSTVGAWKGRQVEWGGYQFSLLPEHGLEWCRYIRVRLMNTVGLVGEELVGVVFIPISDFPVCGQKPVEKVYSVSLRPLNSSLAISLLRRGAKPTLKLRLSKIASVWSMFGGYASGDQGDEKIPHALNNPDRPSQQASSSAQNPRFSMRSNETIGKLSMHVRLQRANEYSAYWAADGVSAITLGKPQAPAQTGQNEVGPERFAAAPGYEGLVLENISEAALIFERGLRDTSVDSADRVPAAHSMTRREELAPSAGDSNDHVDPEQVVLSVAETIPESSTSPKGNEVASDQIDSALSASSDEIIVAIYQHQRRKFPTGLWAEKGLMCGDPPAYTDSQGKRCNFDIPAPPGAPVQAFAPRDCDWTSDWKADDWEYGSSFAVLKDKNGNRRPLPILGGVCTMGVSSVRRRRWSRAAIPIGSAQQKEYVPVVPTKREEDKSKAVRLKSQHKLVFKHSREGSVSNGTTIIIPWAQVNNADVVSPSVLCVNAVINQYFCDARGKEDYHPVNVDVFFTCCPALDLQSLINERIEFARPFELSDGSQSSSQRDQLGDSLASMHSLLVENQSYDFSVPILQDEEGSKFPAAIDLPPGLMLLMMLDHDARFQEETLQALSLHERGTAATASATEKNKSDSKSVIPTCSLDRQKRALERGAFRRRVYIAALHSVSAYSYSSEESFRDRPQAEGGKVGFETLFDTDELEEGIKSDFVAGETIKLENSVSTAKNRTFFLLDMFECRLRLLCLCGWNLQGGALEEAVETLINGYFIIIVSKYARFFDVQELEKNEEFKGLNSKISLINTLMDHDLKMDSIIKEALRPYNLTTQPTPKLSYFLKMDHIIGWYSTVLHEEMGKLVDRVVSQCKAESKDSSAAEYSAVLPWYPTRVGDSPLCSTMPEDIRKFLTDYLLLARFSEATVADHFKPSIDILDAKVFQSYAHAFSRLSKVYWLEIATEKDWTDAEEIFDHANASNSDFRDGELVASAAELSTATIAQIDATKKRAQEILDQRAEWLCSVANDAMRVVANKLIVSVGTMRPAKKLGTLSAQETQTQKLMSKNRAILANVVDKTAAGFQRVELVAIDTLSSLLFSWTFQCRLDSSAFRMLEPAALRAISSVLTGVKLDEHAAMHKWLQAAKSSYRSASNPDAARGGVQNSHVSNLAEALPGGVGSDGILDNWLIDLQRAIELQGEFLQADCYLQLVQICMDKCIVHRLSILKAAAIAGKKLDMLPAPESITLGQELISLQETFEELVHINDATNRSITGAFVDIPAMLEPLSIAAQLISSPLNSESYSNALSRVILFAKTAASSATSGSASTLPEVTVWGNFLECCLSLRKDAGGAGIVFEPVAKRSSITDRSNIFGSWGLGLNLGGENKNSRSTPAKLSKDQSSSTTAAISSTTPAKSESLPSPARSVSPVPRSQSTQITTNEAMQQLALLASAQAATQVNEQQDSNIGELANIHPVMRVFARQGPLSGLTCNTLLLRSQSFVPYSTGDEEHSILGSIRLGTSRLNKKAQQYYTPDKTNTDTRTSNSNGRWFASSATPMASISEDTSDQKGSANTKEETRARGITSLTVKLSRVRSLTTMKYGHGYGNSDKAKIILKDVYATNLLYLSRLSAPKPYLQFEFNGAVLYRTTVRDNSYNSNCTNPDWRGDAPFEFSLPHELLSTKVLHVVLYYSGALYGEDKVGYANISLANLDIEPLLECGYAINCSATENGKRSVKMAEKENRMLPMVYVTLSFKEEADEL